MERNKITYFVSDVHLGLNIENPKEREQCFVKFLQFINTPETAALYLLGDIWDFWYEYKDVVPKGYVKVFSSLVDLMENGITVYFIRGNHDIWCYHYFEELGIKILNQPYHLSIGVKTFCLGHGDGLGPGHFWYKVMRKCFYNTTFQKIFSLLHPYLAFRIGKGWSKKSRVAKKREYIFRGKEEPLYIFAEDFLKKHKTDFFIFGHYHTNVKLDINQSDPQTPSSRLFILKDWIDKEKASYLYFDGMSVGVGYVKNIL